MRPRREHMNLWSNWWVPAILIAILAGCGGTEELAGSSEPLAACEPTALTWPAGSPVETSRCPGPWEYAKHVQPCWVGGTSDPSGAVCGASGAYDQTQCANSCADPAFGAAGYTTKTITGVVVSRCALWKTRCYYEDTVPPTRVCEEYCAATAQTCNWDAAIEQERANWPEPYASAITFTQTTGVPTCQGTLSNIPTGWSTGTDATICGTHSCDDPTKPIYKTCEYPPACPLQLNADGSKKLFYSPPNKTYDEIRVGAGAAAAVDWYAAASSLYQPRCTTCEDLPAGSAAEIRAKYDCLNGYASNYSAIAKDPDSNAPGLPGKITQRMKMLLEYKGDLLVDPAPPPGWSAHWRRDAIVWRYQFVPLERFECGERWLTLLPDGDAPLAGANGFEPPTGQTPLYGWSASGAAAGTGAAHSGSYAAQLGPGSGTLTTGYSYVARSFTVPQGGGTLSFWYKTTCDAGASGEGATWHVYDNTARTYVVAPTAATCSATAWSMMSVNLAAAAGHSVSFYLRNYDNPATLAAAYTLYDDVTWTYIPRELDGVLLMCDRLTQSHVPEAVRAYMQNNCVDYGWSVRAVPWSYTKRQDFANRYEDVIRGFFDKPASANAFADSVTALRARLALVSRWYGVAKWSASAADNLLASQADVWAEASAVSGCISKAAHGTADAQLSAAFALPSGDYATILDDYHANSLSLDRAVLSAAFPLDTNVAAPLSSAPLLLVVSDALRPVSNRLGETDAYHDVGCRFGTCAAGTATESSQIQKLVSFLPDGTRLSTAANADTAIGTDPSGNDWRTVFKAIAARHSVLRTAVTEVRGGTYTPASLSEVWTGGPLPIQDLNALVRDNAKRTDNYSKSGLFLADSKNHLSAGIQAEKLQDVTNLVSTLAQALSSQVDLYNSSRRQVVNDLLAEKAGARELYSLASQLDVRLIQIDQQSEDLAGLRLSAQIESAKFGDFGGAYKRAVEAMNADPNYQNYRVNVVPQAAKTLTAGNAVWGGTAHPTLGQASVSGWGFPVVKGDVLEFRVTGAWSPTCALMHAPAQADGIPITAVPDALAGPEGYSAQFSTSSYAAAAFTVSDEDSRWSTYSQTKKSCNGKSVSGGVSGGVGPVQMGVNAYVSTESCINKEWGTRTAHTTTDSTSSGTDTRNSAAFTHGLRLTNTPFPEYPVGSLLLLKMPTTATAATPLTQAIDVQVLQPASTIVVEDAAQLYLVVNDLMNPSLCPAPSTAALTVNVNVLRPVTDALSDTFGRSLANAHATMMQQARQYLAQGKVSSSELSFLRDAAFNQYTVDCQARPSIPVGATCDFAALPPALHGFFSTWVSGELARVEREVNIRALERQMEVAIVELDAIKRDLEAQRQQGRLLALMPAWSLRTVDADQLRSPARDLATVLAEQAYPHIALRYPATLDRVSADTVLRGKVQALIDAGARTSAVALAEKLRDVANGVMAKLGMVVAEAQQTKAVNLRTIAVSFDNPDYVLDPWGPPNTNPYTKADPARARELWDAIDQVMANTRDVVPFTVLPEDVYARSGASILVCEKPVPVIQSVAFWVARNGSENGALNAANWSGSLQIAPEMTFAALDGPSPWEMTNGEWLADQVRLLFGLAVDAPTTFETLAGYPKATAAGLTPFTSFEVNVSGLRSLGWNPFADDSAYAVIVLFQVDPRSAAAPGATWIETCAL